MLTLEALPRTNGVAVPKYTLPVALSFVLQSTVEVVLPIKIEMPEIAGAVVSGVPVVKVISEDVAVFPEASVDSTLKW